MSSEKKLTLPLTDDRRKKLDEVKEALGVSGNGEMFDKLYEMFAEQECYKSLKPELEEAKRLDSAFHDFLFHLLDVVNKRVDEATRSMAKTIESLQAIVTEKKAEIEKVSKENEQMAKDLAEKDALIKQLINKKTLTDDTADTSSL